MSLFLELLVYLMQTLNILWHFPTATGSCGSYTRVWQIPPASKAPVSSATSFAICRAWRFNFSTLSSLLMDFSFSRWAQYFWYLIRIFISFHRIHWIYKFCIQRISTCLYTFVSKNFQESLLFELYFGINKHVAYLSHTLIILSTILRRDIDDSTEDNQA